MACFCKGAAFKRQHIRGFQQAPMTAGLMGAGTFVGILSAAQYGTQTELPKASSAQYPVGKGSF
jgi:hypothetical protein